MTTIVYRAGIMAADSRETIEHEDRGVYFQRCEKLFVRSGDSGARYIIGLEGESTAGMVFLDWFSSQQGLPKEGERCEALAGTDFQALVLCKKGLFEYDEMCRAIKVTWKFHAIGSGAKAALGALHMGATARGAVRIAAMIDPYTDNRIKSYAL